MSTVTKTVYFENAGAPVASLTPTWTMLKRVSDGANVSQPAITELGSGYYKFSFSNPTYGEKYVGVINGGISLPVAYRYEPVEICDEVDGKRNKDLNVNVIYNEDADSLTFTSYLLEDGVIKTTDLTSMVITVYDEANSLKFSVNGSTFTNGINVLVKNDPEFTPGESYYAICVLTTTQGTITSCSVFNVIK